MNLPCNKALGKCKAECCDLASLPKDFVKQNRKKVQRKILAEKEFYHRTNAGTTVCFVLAVTEDGKCPFLSSKLECAVYENRPYQCKMFGKESMDKALRCDFMDEKGNLRD